MSKKHHNYTNYSKPQEAPVVGVDLAQGNDFSTPVVEPEVIEPVVEEVTEEPVSGPVETLGVVTECMKLNVRKEPSLDAEILTEILIGTEVQVDISESTADFYKICTEAGVEGYCMRAHINVNA